ncbi:helix-turn-helix domain-containing protein [Amycolatopsis sp. NPDC058986]|uniref:helix-turn-helix domain-containing protein n=1 Tax=unclassified Amycolatopsis TaxID=2618356 RepID=UPI00366ACE75
MFTPQRLVLARHRRGLTTFALADACGMTTPQLADLERGHRAPTMRQAAVLAQVLHVPPAFLTTTAPDPIPATTLFLRPLPAFDHTGRHAAAAIAVLVTEIYRWIDQHIPLPDTDLPPLDGTDPATAAGILRARRGLGTGPAPSLPRLLDTHGVRLATLPLERSAIGSFSFWHDATPYVVLDTTRTAAQRRHDAAHELAHLVLHRTRRHPRAEAERDADRFAAAFLLPEPGLRDRMPDTTHAGDVVADAESWRVAPLVLAHRLHDLAMLSTDQYRAVCVDLVRADTPHHPTVLDAETSPQLDTVFAALSGRRHGLGVLAAGTHLYRHDVAGLLLGLLTRDRHDVPRPTGARPRLALVRTPR